MRRQNKSLSDKEKKDILQVVRDVDERLQNNN